MKGFAVKAKFYFYVLLGQRIPPDEQQQLERVISLFDPRSKKVTENRTYICLTTISKFFNNINESILNSFCYLSCTLLWQYGFVKVRSKVHKLEISKSNGVFWGTGVLLNGLRPFHSGAFALCLDFSILTLCLYSHGLRRLRIAVWWFLSGNRSILLGSKNSCHWNANKWRGCD